MPVFGRALLALAGAYLLRAISESATIAPEWGVAAGVLYAFFWLFWSARSQVADRLESAIHSLTAVLILCPLMWEAVLSLHAMSAWTASALLASFEIFGLAISWRKNLLAVATIVTLAALATTAGLLIATHNVVPFTLVFVVIAAAVEVSACLEHWLSERWLAALSADLAVLLATWLVTREYGLPAIYAPIPRGGLLGLQVALLAIYFASTVVRTLFRGLTFTAFEITQCAAAIAIGIGGGLQLYGEAHLVALFALACGAACYAVSFLMLDSEGGRARNFYTYSTFAILLTLTGSRILLSAAWASLAWPLLAVVCIGAGVYFGRMTLQVHGVLYLLLGLAASGALVEAGALALGTAHWRGNTGALSLGLSASTVSYLLVLRSRKRAGSSAAQIFRLASAAIFGWLLAGASAGALTALYHELAGTPASHSYCAVLRTGALAALALACASVGARWKLTELSRLTYPAMLLGAYRIAMVDFAQENKPALFLSLLLYGGVLIVLPRMARSPAEVTG